MSRPSSSALIACIFDPAQNERPSRLSQYLQSRGLKVDTLSLTFTGSKSSIHKAYTLPYFRLFSCTDNIKYLLSLLAYLTTFIPSNFLRSCLTPLLFNAYKYIHILPFQILARMISIERYDDIFIEDIEFLPFLATKSTNTILDLREFYPRQQDSSPLTLLHSSLAEHLISNYAPLVTTVLSVSPGLCSAYRDSFALNPILLRSTPFKQDITPHALTSYPIKLVYHGSGNSNRNLLEMAHIIESLNGKYHLDMILVGNSRCTRALRRVTSSYQHVSVVPPVPFSKVISHTAINYDAGFYFTNSRNFNVVNMLPNKFFQFIQSRLAVIIGPSVWMSELVHKYNCGYVSEFATPESIHNLLSSLTLEDITLARQGSHLASQTLCWEHESLLLDPLISANKQ